LSAIFGVFTRVTIWNISVSHGSVVAQIR